MVDSARGSEAEDLWPCSLGASVGGLVPAVTVMVVAAKEAEGWVVATVVAASKAVVAEMRVVVRAVADWGREV